jgi:hypothetical protein
MSCYSTTAVTLLLLGPTGALKAAKVLPKPYQPAAMKPLHPKLINILSVERSSKHLRLLPKDSLSLLVNCTPGY